MNIKYISDIRRIVQSAFKQVVISVWMVCSFSTLTYAQAFYKGVQNIQVTWGYGGYYSKMDKTILKSVLEYHNVGFKHASLRKVDPNTKKLLYSPYSYAIHYDYGYKAIRVFGFRKKKIIGLGGYLGTRTFREREPAPPSPVFFDRRWRYYTLMFEGKLHWDFPGTRFDPYLNVAIGAQMRRYKILNLFVPDPTEQFPKTKFMIAGQLSIGTRYYFSRNAAFVVEGGFGVYYLKVGLNVILIP